MYNLYDYDLCGVQLNVFSVVGKTEVCYHVCLRIK